MEVVNQVSGENWTLYNGDCVEVVSGLKKESVDYTIYSPPFSSLYTYSDSTRDMGNCKTDKEFMEHFSFLAVELFRVTKPGRLMSFHCMNIPAMKERDGYIGIKDFRGDLIRIFQNAGFIYHAEVLIWKDPLIEATRTKALGLMHKQLCKDSSKCRHGLPDYVVTMRKPGDNQGFVPHHKGLFDYAGSDDIFQITADKRKEKIADGDNVPDFRTFLSHNIWRAYASPVWMDIRQTRTLNFREARNDKDERHICPLQLDTIERCITLWSNPGDVVLSPFAGIGSEGYVALELERKFLGVELKESYFDVAVKNLKQAENIAHQPTLFK